ncbi:MAG: TnpV protein [Clostridia bacterium]|nr:TnpV protein [Clostridia bacterium]
MANLTYIRTGDYYIPNLALPENASYPLGKYGRMRERHLKETHTVLYNVLMLSGKLLPHLQGIDNAASARMDTLMPQLMQTAGVTEELKAADPLRWVGLMNTLKAQAEEVILSELIYAEEQEVNP